MKSNLAILAALATGIVIDLQLGAGLPFLILVTVLLLLAIFLAKPRSLLLALTCGMIAHHTYNFEYRKNSPLFSALDKQKIRVTGHISQVKKYPFAFGAVLEADSLTVQEQKIAVEGKYQFYLNYTPDFNEGDLLTLEGKFALYPAAQNKGEFDRRENAVYNHLNGTLEYPKLINSAANKSWLNKVLYISIQNFVITTYNEMLPYKSANFQNALFLGVKTGMEKEDLQAFADSGTLHLLAVSGMHVAFLLLLLGFIKKYLRVPLKFYIPTAILLLLGYTILTGASPSVVRAFLMAALFLLSYPLKRMISGLDLLAGAGLFSLLINPNQLFTLSFQLSYLAVLSILLIYQRVEELMKPAANLTGKKINKFALEPINISIAVSLGTLPLLLYAGSCYNLLSILANVPLIPLTTLSYLGGIVLLITAPLAVLGDFNAYLLNLLNQFIFYLIELTAGMDSFILRFKADGILTVLLFAILVYLLARDYKIKIVSQLICCGCLVCMILTKSIPPAYYVFATAKGEAVYMNCSGEKVVYLAEAGAYDIKSKVLAYLTANNIHALDYLVTKGLAAEDLNELCSKVKIRTLIAEDNPEMKEAARMHKINLLQPDYQTPVKLDNGRIYFYTNGVLLQNRNQQFFCSTGETNRAFENRIFTQKSGRKKQTWLNRSGKLELLEKSGGIEILPKMAE